MFTKRHPIRSHIYHDPVRDASSINCAGKTASSKCRLPLIPDGSQHVNALLRCKSRSQRRVTLHKDPKNCQYSVDRYPSFWLWKLTWEIVECPLPRSSDNNVGKGQSSRIYQSIRLVVTDIVCRYGNRTGSKEKETLKAVDEGKEKLVTLARSIYTRV